MYGMSIIIYHYYTILENFGENKCAQEFCHSSDENRIRLSTEESWLLSEILIKYIIDMINFFLNFIVTEWFEKAF